MTESKLTAKIGDIFHYGGNEFKITSIVKNRVFTVTKVGNREVCWDIWGIQAVIDNQHLYYFAS